MVNGIITARCAPLEKGMLRAFQLGHGKRWNDRLLNRLTVTYLKGHPLSNGLMRIPYYCYGEDHFSNVRQCFNKRPSISTIKMKKDYSR